MQVNHPGPGVYQQSTEQVWKCVTSVLKAVLPGPEDKLCVRGMGFDATCSLVLVDEAGEAIRYNTGI